MTLAIILGVVWALNWLFEDEKHAANQHMQIAILWFILAQVISIADTLGGS